MNRHFVRAAGMLISFCLAFLPLSTGIAQSAVQGETSPDVLIALGFAGLLHDDAAPESGISRTGSVETTISEYADVSLPEVLALAGKLEEARWYLTGDSALKDRRTLLARYDMKTRRLLLELTQDAGKNVWPDVLTPLLSSTTPVFASGVFKSSAPVELADRVDCMQLTFEKVAPEDVLAYADLLISSGFTLQEVKGFGTEYVRNITFIRIFHQEDKQQLDIIVGQYMIYPVPLPPWPDPLPEQLKRALPPVPAKQNVDAVTAGHLATVINMPLFTLYRFIHAAEKRYGWSAPQDDAVMVHQKLSVRLEFLAYNTDAHRLLFLMEQSEQAPPK